MPKLDGELTPEDVAKVRAFLKGKARTDPHPCPYCGTTRWTMAGYVVSEEIPDATYEAENRGAPIVVSILFLCDNCAYTMRFNAGRMGIHVTGPEDGTVYPDALSEKGTPNAQ